MTKPSKRQVVKALWQVVDYIHKTSAGDGESLESTIARQRAIIDEYCPIYRDWFGLVRMHFDGDAIGAADILEYYSGYRIHHPFLRGVQSVLEELEETFPIREKPRGAPIMPGLTDWISLDEPSPGAYLAATPRNCLAFQDTGGDGVHYALLAIDESIDDQSPVVQVDPGTGTAEVVARNLREFLCLGLETGWQDMQYCHEHAPVEPHSSRFDPTIADRFAAFADRLDLSSTSPEPDVLRDLNEQFGGLVEEPWFKPGRTLQDLVRKRDAWFHVRRRIRRYLGL